MTDNMKITTGIIVGALVGATVGILFAPKKGAKTRAIIVDKTKALGASMHKGMERGKSLVGLKDKVQVNETS